jgi:hypothetical protein
LPNEKDEKSQSASDLDKVGNKDKNELNDLSDLLDPEKNKEYDFVFVTDSEGKQHVVSKNDLIR